MKTRAAVVRKIGMPWEITELDLDAPRANEVLIRLEAAGLCYSDEARRIHDHGRLPLVGGHEGAGVVVEAGPGVTRVKVGDRVACHLSLFAASAGIARASGRRPKNPPLPISTDGGSGSPNRLCATRTHRSSNWHASSATRRRARSATRSSASQPFRPASTARDRGLWRRRRSRGDSPAPSPRWEFSRR